MHMAFNQLLRRARLAFRVFSLFLFIIGGASMARAEVRFDVFPGYDGTVREAAWFPITCEIFNDGPPIRAIIEVTPANYGKGQTQRVPVELPTGTLKRIVIPAFMPNRYPTPWDLRLLDERGRVVKDTLGVQPQRTVGWETKIIGSLPRAASGAVSLRSIKRNQPDMQPASTRFQPAMLPDNPLLLESLDAIYLNSETVATLRSSQVNALIAWMNAGGHLIVAIEQVSDVNGATWLKNIMPVEPREIVPVSRHDELNRWVRDGTIVTNTAPEEITYTYPPGVTVPGKQKKKTKAQNSPQVADVQEAFSDVGKDAAFEAAEIRVVTGVLRDGKAVVSVGELPLVVTANRGLGRITALMFSPEREPFKSWKDLPTFWTKMLEVPMELFTSTTYYPGYGSGADGIFGAMLDSRQVHKLPVGWLLVLLVVYLLVIGPFDRIWLKKINRPMLTWITFPCYVIFFSGLIYFIGYRLRAGESELNELHVVDVLKNGDRAEMRGRSYMSIYSPSNAKYPMQSTLKFATLRGEYLASGRGQGADKTELLHTGDNFRADVFVPVWTSQLCLSDWWTSGELPLTASIKPKANGWTVTVENHSGKAVTVVRLVVSRLIFDLGTLSPGEKKTLELDQRNAISTVNFVRNLAGQYQSVLQQRQYAFGSSGGGHIDDLPSASMAVSLLGEVASVHGGMNFPASPGLELSANVKDGSALLLAWSPGASPVPQINQFKTKRTASNTLWRMPVVVGK